MTNADTLMKQAPATAGLYLNDILAQLRQITGKPDHEVLAEYQVVIAAMLNVCSHDFDTAIFVTRDREAHQ